MKLHPIKEYLDNLASSEIFRVIPATYEYVVRKKDSENVLLVLNSFVHTLQERMDVYERIAFQIEPYDRGHSLDSDDEFVRIRGRYGFSEVTAAGGKGKRIKTDHSFYEVPYGGDCIDLNGRYTLLELQAIVEKATIERGFK
jgi:hypothetical protein